jgi:serine protease Do
MTNQRKFTLFFVLILGVIIGGIVASQLEWTPKSNAENATPSTATLQLSQQELASVENLNTVFVAIAEQVKPSVVTIFTDKVVKQRRTSPFFSDPFRGFFGDLPFGVQPAPETEQHLQGMGSGVIVSNDGYILTNNHVVREADRITVMLLGGKKVEAKIVGTDAKTDIAVVKVDASDLKPIVLGDSDKLRVGEWVMAIGSPLSQNLAHTVTAGIVSAKGRSNVGLADYEDFIQTDAAINPGNSGGALVNFRGELIGINTAIASRSGGFQGIGFAVPIKMAARVKDSLIRTGRVVRGWLGVVIQDVDEQLVESMNLPSKDGALVADVAKDGPAERSGLQSGDFIFELDGQKISNMTQLRNEIAIRAPGTQVQLKLIRNGDEQSVSITLGELPGDTAMPAAKESLFDRLGFSVQNLDAQLAPRLGLKPDDQGVIIAQIAPDSPAYVSGLRRGDLIKEVNRRPVKNVDEFTRMVSGLKSGGNVLIHGKRRGTHFFTAFAMR